jgi:hypothetical protein
MIPFVGSPVFIHQGKDVSMVVRILSPPTEDGKPGTLDFHTNVTVDSGTVVRADCPQTEYFFDEISMQVLLKTSMLSCVSKFRSALLGYWSRDPVGFTWNAAELTLVPNFGAPIQLKFDMQMTETSPYEMIGFLS